MLKNTVSRRSLLKGLIMGAAVAPFAGSALPVAAQDHGGNTIVDVAVGAGIFKTLVAALQAAGLVETLMGKGPFTVFAPTDEAFAKLPSGTVETLLKPENKATLVSILTYHVAAGRRSAGSLATTGSARSLQGGPIGFALNGKEATLTDGKGGTAKVITANVRASNGIVHIIDTVIMPPDAPKSDIVDTAVGAGTFKTLVAAVQAAGLVETLKGAGPFTVFAPSDEAFAKLPEGLVGELVKPENKAVLTQILTYHVVAGNLQSSELIHSNRAPRTVQGERLSIYKSAKGVMVNKSIVTAANILTTNGVIHVIDSVLLPKGIKLPKVPPKPVDIVDTAVAAGSFKTLVAAVQAAGLVETLKGTGPFTVFAPTDAAFAKVDKATLAKLLLPENKAALVRVLTYHVVAGAVKAADVVKLTSAKTVEGNEVKITVTDGKVMVDNANVTATDVIASNGVIHIIDAVLLPPNLEIK